MKRRIIAVIQARMGSTRLPGKVLKKIGGKTIVGIIYERLKSAKEIDGIVLSIPASKENDALAKEGKLLGAKTFRFKGDERDVISRHLEAIRYAGGADAMVLITADCVFVDPLLVDSIVRACRKNFSRYAYFTNTCPPSFPDGFDVEVFPVRTLRKLNRELKGIEKREWFALYINENPKKFPVYNLMAKRPHVDFRVTIDYPKDLELARKIYNKLAPKNKLFSADDIITLLEQRSKLARLNAEHIDHVADNGLYRPPHEFNKLHLL